MASKKRLLNEVFHLRQQKISYKNGNSGRFVYVDPALSESLFGEDGKSKLSGYLSRKYHMKFNGYKKLWGWEMTDEYYNRIMDWYIKPFLEEVNGKEFDMLIEIQEMERELEEGGQRDYDDSIMSIEEVKERLKSFEDELVQAFISGNFTSAIRQIIDFDGKQGHQLSFGNALLVMLQDPEATEVHSRGAWERNFGRRVIEGAKSVLVKTPVGDPYSPQEKKQIEADFLKKYNVNSVDELPGGLKDVLEKKKNGLKEIRGWKFCPNYDIRFTEPIPGYTGNTNDSVSVSTPTEGPRGLKNDQGIVTWSPSGHSATDLTQNMCNAVINSAKSRGVKIDYVNSLGGALGVSTGGQIRVLNGAKGDVELLDTLIHEYAHELLHQRYLRDKDSSLNAYVGRSNRGTIEQQAELTAWVVMKYFNLEQVESINYAGSWGATDKEVNAIVKKILQAASIIVNDIKKFYGQPMVEKRMINEEELIMEPIELARMLGVEDAFVRGEQEIQKDQQMFESLIRVKPNLWMI